MSLEEDHFSLINIIVLRGTTSRKKEIIKCY